MNYRRNCLQKTSFSSASMQTQASKTSLCTVHNEQPKRRQSPLIQEDQQSEEICCDIEERDHNNALNRSLNPNDPDLEVLIQLLSAEQTERKFSAGLELEESFTIFPQDVNQSFYQPNNCAFEHLCSNNIPIAQKNFDNLKTLRKFGRRFSDKPTNHNQIKSLNDTQAVKYNLLGIYDASIIQENCALDDSHDSVLTLSLGKRELEIVLPESGKKKTKISRSRAP